MNPLIELSALGQSPWLDDLHRDLVLKGGLKKMIDEEGLRGMTSNPSIFEKAIGETDEYKDELQDLLSKGQLDDMAIYETLAVADIKAACDVFRPVYDKTHKLDGYVSLEVPPGLAMETGKTVEEAKRLWKLVGRDNLMVKVPGTTPGVPAIKELIGQGININVTLLFSIGAYEKVVESYIAGLETFDKAGGDVSKVASVASFFLSRIDTVVDKQLSELPADKKSDGEKLKGKIAIAWAKLAYQRWIELFSGARWEALAAKGAKPQRLLWASTGTKDPALPKTYYVDALIGKLTVNTMPDATMKAFAATGTAKSDTIESDIPGAKAAIESLPKLGISLQTITDDLVEDGVKKFVDSFDKLLGGVAKKRRELAGAAPNPKEAAA
ncbi:transaldolase [Lichenifustis flavocetrariae]|uniref:Transaldolase n=1 Tax=Lichenifustis flavocetrariae TaxID=2949735 RepID=A0AA41YUA9_9HYPH|nr:transaldolase [Lichenifustis flavocetrariae]MCW6508706.1 transaldolase [Lichenifustis flavocetrariae]